MVVAEPACISSALYDGHLLGIISAASSGLCVLFVMSLIAAMINFFFKVSFSSFNSCMSFFLFQAVDFFLVDKSKYYLSLWQ